MFNSYKEEAYVASLYEFLKKEVLFFMKKFFLMVFALIFIATGCYNVDNTKVTENKSPKSGIEEIKIPFFVYTNESDNKYAARLCY